MPTHYAGTPEEVRALNTWIKFTRAGESVSSRLWHRGTIEDLTPTQFAVLETLHHLGPMCQRAIGSKILKSSGNITLVIDNLHKRGLVRRDQDPDDRRMEIVSLTPAGQETIARIMPGHVAAIVDEMNVLTAEEQETFAGLCARLGKHQSGGEATSS
jgi:MarR family 2-MHQ and catechol resistance regulon transcriptional repressor